MADRIEDIDSDDSMDIEWEDLDRNIENLVDEDEEAVLSDDSGCDSVISEQPDENLVERVLPNAQYNALNRNTKCCMIQFYYVAEDRSQKEICVTCMFESKSEDLGVVRTVRYHETDSYICLREKYCSYCRKPVFMYIPCNMCPICVFTQ